MTIEQPINERYYVSGQNVIFIRHRFILHINICKNYNGLTLIEARRKLKRHYTKSEQNEILHYLKNNNILKS